MEETQLSLNPERCCSAGSSSSLHPSCQLQLIHVMSVVPHCMFELQGLGWGLGRYSDPVLLENIYEYTSSYVHPSHKSFKLKLFTDCTD